MIYPTLSLEQAAKRRWDALVVGAGPAGAFAAHELSRRGLGVLLVDKARFPREKVCGCCLNGTAIRCLEKTGLSMLLVNHKAVPLTRLQLVSGKHVARVPLAREFALSRAVFDAALVTAAINQGAHFLPETSAYLGPSTESHREVRLTHRNGLTTARARLVLAADGLSGRFSATRIRTSQETGDGWLGVQTIHGGAPLAYHARTLYMACGIGGYLGLVRLEDQRLNIAAALDPRYLRHAGSVGRAVSNILAATELPRIGDLGEQRWQGTPPLTHRSKHLARDRLFALGDAAGFVQPFTGEGIAWALLSAEAVIPLAIRAAQNWNSSLKSEWSEVYRRTIVRRQATCGALSMILRYSTPTSVMVRLLGQIPSAAPTVLRWLGLSGQKPAHAAPRTLERMA